MSGADHVDMRRIMHGYFTPKSIEMWRPLVQSAIDELLDAVEEKGRMDVMADLATPLPLLVIARMLGIPDSERPRLRELAKDLRFLNREGPRPDEAPEPGRPEPPGLSSPPWSKTASPTPKTSTLWT